MIPIEKEFMEMLINDYPNKKKDIETFFLLHELDQLMNDFKDKPNNNNNKKKKLLKQKIKKKMKKKLINV